MEGPYIFNFMPKLILGSSFDFDEQGDIFKLATIVDDPDVLSKCASSRVVKEWGEIEPVKNASLIHLIALGATERTGCFFEGTPVQTYSGLKPIERIEKGDFVLTHKNRYRRVTEKFVSEYSGPRTSIKVAGLPIPLVSTGNHPHWIVRAKDFGTVNRCLCHLKRKGVTKERAVQIAVSKAQFVQARDVKKGDFVLIPVNPEPVLESQYPDDAAYLMGLYVAEGCIAREYRDIPTKGEIRRIVFVVSRNNDIPVVERVVQIAKGWDRILDIQPSPTSDNGLRLGLSHKPFAIQCFDLFGGHATTKRIPAEIFSQSREWKLNFLAGYFDGDGCLTLNAKNPRYENTLRGSTASLNLALDLQRLLASLLVPSSVNLCYNKESNGCFGSGDLPIYSVSVGGAYSAEVIPFCARLRQKTRIQKNKQSNGHVDGDYLLLPVGAVVSDMVAGETKFNLEVEEDNTYQTLFLGHNSNRNGDGFRRNFLKSAHPTFKKHGALYKDHLNKEYEKRYGDVEKTAFNDDMDRTELLVSARHDKCADWLHDIERGKRVDFSMGFDCVGDVCSICGNYSKTRKSYCEHVKKGAKAPYGMGRILPDGRKCYVDNPDGVFNDISKVGTGADMIAQHLRKVAGLDDTEVLGGADMMEALGYKQAGADISLKYAIAHKCSRIEKILPAVSYGPVKSRERISKKVAQKLRGATPPILFAELAKIGAVLPFREFFRLILGTEKYAGMEDLVLAAEDRAPRHFSVIAEDPERLRRVCENTMYDGIKHGYASILNDYDSVELVREFSIMPELANERAVRMAISGELREEKLAHNGDPRLDCLLDEYAAYKLAALEGTQWNLSDEVIVAASMVS